MRIRLLAFAFLVFFFARLPLLALAEEKKFTDFTLNVPESCSAEEKQSILNIRCHDSSFFALSLRSSGPKSGREAADELASRYQGNTPMLNEYGNYFFDTEQNGISTKVELIERDNLLLVYMSDNNPDGWPETLSKAFDSITGNTPAIDEFVKKYLLSPPDEQP